MREHLVEQWSLDPGTEVVPAGPHLEIHRWAGRTGGPPIRLIVTDDDLRTFAEDLDMGDLAAVWPGRDRAWTALALLSVWVEETLATQPWPRELRLVDGELVVAA
ncbi:hypothetical protein ACO229_04080 [Promicromonospora sp. MS192]|uniref:hypothetical protein n=1 Tax=Promicromonospora sp. MS192 TaxID=3412684 RepID=UPI003C2D2345